MSNMKLQEVVDVEKIIFESLKEKIGGAINYSELHSLIQEYLITLSKE